MSDIQILRAGDRPARRWLNGGGRTWDVLAFPPGSDLTNFDWRLSIAEVSEPGAFSHFAGIDRSIAILRGVLNLDIGQDTSCRLTVADMPYAFAGDVPVFGTPVDGPVIDLNLMIRRGSASARMLRSQPGLYAPAARQVLIFALTATQVTISASIILLEPFDACWISAPLSDPIAIDRPAIIIEVED